MVVADRIRTTWKKKARENGNVKTECVLMQKAAFGGKLYVAQPEIGAAGRRLTKARGEGRCELKVLHRS
jgi:hypothetical protein